MGSFAGAIREHLTAARGEIAAVDRLLRIGNANKKLMRLCDDVAMTIGSLEMLVDQEDENE